MSSDPSRTRPGTIRGGSPAPEHRGFGVRWVIWLTLLVLAGPCLYVETPREVAYWYVAAAIEDRSHGRADAAYAKLEKALSWSPSEPAVLFRRAAWRTEDGQYETALKDCNRALEVSGENSRMLMQRTQTLQHLGRHAEAIEDWKLIDRRSKTSGVPPREVALNGMAYARAVGNLEIEEGLKEVNEALKLSPGDAAILDTRGFLLYRKGDDAAALKDFNDAIEGMERHLARVEHQLQEPLDDFLFDRIPGEDVKLARHGLAVGLYHRALLLKRLDMEENARIDLDRARKLIGREPDETLF